MCLLLGKSPVASRYETRSLVAALLWLVAGLTLANGQSILRVEIRDKGEPPPPMARGVIERHLVKFFDEMEVPGELVYDAHWEAPPGGLDGPVFVIMTYRQVGHREMRRLVVRYPDGARGRQIARFRISEEQVQRWGGVTAWRIELRQGNRLLDDQVSGLWR